MKILVGAKRVPDPEIKVKVRADGTGIEQQDLTYKLNPFDEIAIEEAVRIKEKIGAEVILLTICSKDFQTEIYSGLAFGADRAIQVDYDGYIDPYMVAQIFNKVVEQEGVDLVLMGKQAVDDDSNQAAQMLACLLDWPQACFASEIEIQDSKAVVRREVDKGIETIEVSLPAVITADLRLNEPRYPTLPMVLKGKKKKIDIIQRDELDLDTSERIKYLSLEKPPGRHGECKIFEDVDALIDALQNEASVIK